MITVFSTLKPIIFWLLQKWVESQENKAEIQKAMDLFIKQVDQSGTNKVDQHLSAQEMLKLEQEKLERENNGIQN